MAKLFIDKNDIASRAAWFYVLMHEAPIEIYEFNPNNEELEEENPLKMVPFLIDGHVKVWGSQATIFYIAEKYSAFEGLGKTFEERAKTESILAWANTTLYRTVITDFVAPQIYEDEALPGESSKIQVEFARKSLTEQLDVLEGSYLKIKNYMIQDSVHFVDYYVVVLFTSRGPKGLNLILRKIELSSSERNINEAFIIANELFGMQPIVGELVLSKYAEDGNLGHVCMSQ
eukprot:gene17262-8825_t